MSTDHITWVKATASGSSGNCVELGSGAGDATVVYLRDSKDTQGPVLRFTRSEIAAFIDGAKRNEFDHLAH
ncbi:DUF397 domain-containing protein [Kineosporia sp. NBRC 101677]|uniref:DUF397 domain-containing protein n=1 Tax=Kineosporia sp. NBRC 101677 TaxID=3032197 RepID=UPI0024A3224B|nr:DUF397 domain-containing protein [Kineosporia sp. NBRC 101677]GLY19555.1 DUF397 domain-containing protein [Kineosporia sp. NBRC 101677]